MRKIKAKANAMEDADVHYISLVTRPASRIPFRLTKSEDDPESEAGFMLNLSKMFKRDGEAPQQGVALVGVVLQRKHEEYLAPQIEKLGLKVDDRVEQDDIVILRQGEIDDECVAIKHGVIGALYRDLPEQVKKAFDPYSESDDFDENMALSFLPGMSAATEALFDTVIAVLRTAESPEDARSRIESNIDKYKSAVMDMASGLPEMAFKLEGLNLEEFVEKEETPEADVEAAAEEAPAEESAPIIPPEAPEAAAEEAPADEGEAPAEEAAEEAAPVEAAKDDGLTPEERETLKGVHIEEIDEPSTETVSKSESSEESEQEDESDISALLTSFKSEVLEAISSVKSEVGELKSKQAELTEKVNDTAAIAERARKAVKGTVRSGSDADDRVRNESLGTRSRKGESKDESTWGGTALDRIVGDFGE
jgi:hypothetical protein